MGIMTRQQGTDYVITSDRSSDDTRTSRAPKNAKPEVYEVWTGERWSADMGEAMPFETLDDADDYVRANYPQVAAQR